MRLDLLDGLIAFCTVADRRSFTAAAADLRVTRSAVSQTIRALEARLGVPLFARTTRDVGLTEAGARYYGLVRPFVTGIALATEVLADSAGRPFGLLRLNVPRIAVSTVIAPLLPGFAAAYPGITVEVFSDDRLANIVEAGFDAGVRLGELVEKDMVSVRLTPPERLLVVGSPAYLAAHGHPADPRELSGHACINFRQSSRGGLYRWEFEDNGTEFDVAVEGQIIVNDSDMKLRAALAGLGLAHELESVVQPYLASGALLATLETFAPVTPGFYLYFPARAQVLPKLRAFIDFARSALPTAQTAGIA